MIRQIYKDLNKFIGTTYSICKFSTKSNSSNDTNDDNKKTNYEESEKRNQDNFAQKALALRGSFEQIHNKNRQTYLEMIRIYENKESVHRRGHTEFIYAALKNMESFGVHQDLEVYKSLIDILPKGKFIPTNIFQAEFMHYPKQQQCIIDVLEQMEDNGVIPDYEMEDMLLNIFGRKGHPVRKFWRMMYWMPKFKNLSPWPVPNPAPNDAQTLAKLAVERMCSVDVSSVIKVFESTDVKDSIDDTWIVSGQSPEQIDLLSKHQKDLPLYIEGPYLIWLRNKTVSYFILRSDPVKRPEMDEKDPDDVSRIRIPKFGQPVDKKIALIPSVHEQEEGTILAICATGTSTKDSLLSWIRCLENDGNPSLANIPVLFKFRSLTGSRDVAILNNEKLIVN